ncbi:MAG: FAD-dependent oxidoreductase [Flavobacteriales bacterium]
MEKKHIQIAGAGLVGSLLSLVLAKKGHKVDIYESRTDTRKQSAYSGRSINLALSDRGWKALDIVGIRKDIEQHAIPMYKRVMHAVDGSKTEQFYGINDQAIYSVSRGGLNNAMVTLAEQNENVNVFFDHKCVDVDLDNTILKTKNSVTGEEKAIKSDLIFGSDGAFSKVRLRMQRTSRFNYEQEYIDHGYKELEIPANADGTHKLEKNALHIWPRGEFMLIALPNMDGSFTCTLFLPFEGEESFNHLTSDASVLAFFKKYFPDTLELIPNLVDVYNSNPTSTLCIIRCYPWVRNKTALIGDASHAIVPFYGQGMNSGFEDCSILHQIIESIEDKNDWDTILDEYQKERKPNTDAIADLAMYNFIEMRDKTADPEFLLRKKIEKKLLINHPDKWVPLYSMVTFSHTPYAEALEIGNNQSAIMDKVMKEIPNIEDIWDSKEVEDKILSYL